MKKKMSIENINVIYDDSISKISIDNNIMIFEIGTELTTDIAEGVSLLMKKLDKNNPIWKTKINKPLIETQKCLYWLSGGDIEWKKTENYNKKWSDVFSEYDDEFKDIVSDIIHNSRTLGTIRDGFNKKLNMKVFYEFALKKKLIKK